MIRRHDSIVVQKITRLLIPIIQMFALYVFFHGHYSPGGGFQGGVLLAAAIILKMLVGSHAERKRFSVRREFLLSTGGVLLFTIVGGLALLMGSNFFDYGALEFLGNSVADRRYYGILIAEAGVLLVVTMTLVLIFHVLAFAPERFRAD